MKKITTPWWIYIILLAVAIVLIIPYTLISDKESFWASVFCNVGYGVFGSLIVAFLIDYANTRAKRKIDKEKLDIISAEYRTVFLDLRDCVLAATELRYGADNKKRAFDDWIDYALAPIDEQQGEKDDDLFDSAFEINYRIEKIEKVAVTFYELLLINIDNETITNEYRQNVKSIRSLASHINALLENGQYQLAAKAVKERLIPNFLNNNKECNHYFLEPYCADRYTED